MASGAVQICRGYAGSCTQGESDARAMPEAAFVPSNHFHGCA